MLAIPRQAPEQRRTILLSKRLDPLEEPIATPQEHGDIPPPMRAWTTRRHEADPGAGGEATVHARDAVVAGTEKTARRLQKDQGRDPGRRRRIITDPLLDPVVLGGDEDVEIVCRANRGPMRIAAPCRHRRLHEGGLGHVLDHEPPGLVRRPVRGQPAQQVAPGLGIRHDRVVVGAVQRQGRELDAEAVPRCALVRPQERKVEHAVFGVSRKKRRQIDRFPLGTVGEDRQQRFGQQVHGALLYRR